MLVIIGAGSINVHYFTIPMVLALGQLLPIKSKSKCSLVRFFDSQ